MKKLVVVIVMLMSITSIYTMTLSNVSNRNGKFIISVPERYSIKKGSEGYFKGIKKLRGNSVHLSIAKFRIEEKDGNNYTAAVIKWGIGWGSSDIDYAFIDDSKTTDLDRIQEMLSNAVLLYENNRRQDALMFFLEILKLDPNNQSAIEWVNKLGNLTFPDRNTEKYASLLKDKLHFPEKYSFLIEKAKKVFINDRGFWEVEVLSGIKFAHIPAGSFTMGSDEHKEDERPVHRVFLEDYWISKYEVTSELFLNYLEDIQADNNKREFFFRNEFPAANVTWMDATDFCRWLSKKLGMNIKLPTEAQWEKAARGSQDNRSYPWGWNPPSEKRVANMKGEIDGAKYYSKVSSFPDGSSPYGIINMAGNVSEWVRDWYDPDYYSRRGIDNPDGPIKGRFKIIRGGSYIDLDSSLRVSSRERYDPVKREVFIGFRVVIER